MTKKKDPFQFGRLRTVAAPHAEEVAIKAQRAGEPKRDKTKRNSGVQSIIDAMKSKDHGHGG